MRTSSVNKAVIMARGLGTRMRRQDDSVRLEGRLAELADTGVKAMIPVGRPFLDYLLGALADAGIAEICLVIGPEHHIIRDYYTSKHPPRRTRIDFAVQAQPHGTADAVAAAERFAGNDHFLALNSDNYYPPAALQALRAMKGAGVALFERSALLRLGNIPPDRIAKFAVAEISPEGHLRKILEKPDESLLASLPPPILISMNCWLFTPAIFEACREIEPSPRGELEITAAVQYAIERLGEPFQTAAIEDGVLDLTSRTDISEVASRLKDLVVDY